MIGRRIPLRCGTEMWSTFPSRATRSVSFVCASNSVWHSRLIGAVPARIGIAFDEPRKNGAEEKAAIWIAQRQPAGSNDRKDGQGRVQHPGQQPVVHSVRG